MKTPHLFPAFLAVLLTGGALFAGSCYARHLEDQAVHGLAAPSHNFFPVMQTNPPGDPPPILQQRTQGIALQAAAFRQADLLPFYGSSEVINNIAYHPIHLFQNYPEGFTIFPVAKNAQTCLPMAQKMAALGSEVKGKKVVLSISPSSFYQGETVAPPTYANNFSLLQGNALAFSTDLGLDFKHRAARRMLQYPGTLAKDPLLRFALDNLADRSQAAKALYYLALPLGKLQTLTYRLKDHWATYRLLREQGPLKSPPRKAAPLDWAALDEQSIPPSRQRGANNKFGFAGEYWLQSGEELTRPAISLTQMREGFRHCLRHSQEWTDLDLLLRELKELGAEPLILSSPFIGGYYDSMGITAEDRLAYYKRLETAAKKFGVEARAFREHDVDTVFVTDQWGHLHCKGWVIYDRALVEFFKGPVR